MGSLKLKAMWLGFYLWGEMEEESREGVSDKSRAWIIIDNNSK